MPVSTPTERKTVVYIEDNVSNLEMVKRVLDSTGRYEVLGATDGESGLELVARVRPRLVLVDLDVPSVNGFEVIRQIKSSPDPAIAAIPIAVVTANVITKERDQAMRAGCEAFIEKPFDIHSFRKQIDQLVGGS